MAKKRHYQASEKTTAEWEKIFANHILDKELVSRIYKEQFNNNNKISLKNPIKNGQAE